MTDINSNVTFCKCPQCNGSGIKIITDIVPCPERYYLPNHGLNMTNRMCHICHGTQIVTQRYEIKCNMCRGYGCIISYALD